MHCASAGELEQGKPVAEALKKNYPNYKLLVSFFSPSGYVVGKKWPVADYVFYLPLDTAKNAYRFVEIVQPKLVVFIKYDYWFHHLNEVKKNNIPLILVSAIFRSQQAFFKTYGGFYKKILRLFTWLFVQDEASLSLLQSIEIKNASVAGDTRFDRVLSIFETNKKGSFDALENIKAFANNAAVLVAGSTWPEDEKLLLDGLKKYGDVALIIVPHEITNAHLQSIEALFPSSVRYSQLNKKLISPEHEPRSTHQRVANQHILIIDSFGMLSRIYQIASVAYIGGGFNKSGIHNTLEAAVWSKPVIFGPNYQKFKEARELINAGAAFSVAAASELEALAPTLFDGFEQAEKSGEAAGKYVRQNSGATDKILLYIQENRLLTMP